VLLIGGSDPPSQLVEVFTGTGWATVTSTAMLSARRDLEATSLPDGRILVTGGVNATGARLQSSELFGGTFVAGPNMGAAHASHRATLLQNGRVLVTGGVGASGVAINGAELYGSGP
jgi:hypothetical protein